MICAVIPTGNREREYKTVYEWCIRNHVTPITIATSDTSFEYAKGITLQSHELNISKWWNIGMDKADELGAETILVLNDDVTLPNYWLQSILNELSKGYSGVSGERYRGSNKIAGFAFVLNAKDGIRANEELKWYHGDDHIQNDCNALNGFKIIPNLRVPNKYARSSEALFPEQIKKDTELYKKMNTMDVTVVVATCGSDEWHKMGDQSYKDLENLGVPIVRVHLNNGTVSQARNKGLTQVKTEYVCFVDADDTLDAEYFNFKPIADVTVTAISYPGRKATIPKVWSHEKRRSKQHEGDCDASCLIDGNYCHVGAIIHTEALKAVGGFKEYPVYEDYGVMLAMHLNGSSFGRREESVYMANVRRNTSHRNQSMPVSERNKVHEQIVEDLLNEYRSSNNESS